VHSHAEHTDSDVGVGSSGHIGNVEVMEECAKTGEHWSFLVWLQVSRVVCHSSSPFGDVTYNRS
jgi:hypothetical protein